MDLQELQERTILLWFGGLLLDAGHVVQIPEGKNVLVVRTKSGPRTVHVSIREDPVVPEGRVVIGTVSEIEDAAADAVVIVGKSDMDLRRVVVVPVQGTKNGWITEGRHYTVSADVLIDIERLHALLAKLGRV